jgi:hypothetical protein
MEHLPLTILIGPESEFVLIDGEVIAGLIEFKLKASSGERIKTHYTCINCFPRPSGQRVPPQNDYQLRIYAGDHSDDTLVSYAGRPIGKLRSVEVKLSATQKRSVHLTAHELLPNELGIALLDLGVEIITETPDTKETAKDPNAAV